MVTANFESLLGEGSQKHSMALLFLNTHRLLCTGTIPNHSGAEAEHPVLLASQQTLNGIFWNCSHWEAEVGAFQLSGQFLHKAPGLLLWWTPLPPALLMARVSAAFFACPSEGFTSLGLAWDRGFSGMNPSHSAPLQSLLEHCLRLVLCYLGCVLCFVPSPSE